MKIGKFKVSMCFLTHGSGNELEKILEENGISVIERFLHFCFPNDLLFYIATWNKFEEYNGSGPIPEYEMTFDSITRKVTPRRLE